MSDIFYDDLDKPFHRPECRCEWCEEWRAEKKTLQQRLADARGLEESCGQAN